MSRKRKYEIDETYYLKVDDSAEDVIDKVTFWSKNWNRTKTVGELMARVTTRTVKGVRKAAGVFVRLSGKSVSLAWLVAKYVIGREPSPRETVSHKDGNPVNNHPSNIEVIKKSEFMSKIRNSK